MVFAKGTKWSGVIFEQISVHNCMFDEIPCLIYEVYDRVYAMVVSTRLVLAYKNICIPISPIVLYAEALE